jgi:hypothetical protein
MTFLISERDARAKTPFSIRREKKKKKRRGGATLALPEAGCARPDDQVFILMRYSWMLPHRAEEMSFSVRAKSDLINFMQKGAGKRGGIRQEFGIGGKEA